MKNDEHEKFSPNLKIAELKSARKIISKKEITKHFSHSKLTPLNMNNYISKFDSSKSNNTERKDKEYTSTKFAERDYASIYGYKNNGSTTSFHKKPTESTIINKKSSLSSTKKCKTTKKIFNINSIINQGTVNNFDNTVKDSFKHINNQQIKIENINNIQNFNNYNIFKKSNSLNKFENFYSNNIANSINLNTPVSHLRSVEKNSNINTEPRNYQKKLSLYNINEIDYFNNPDPNPVKVVVRFRPMNEIENEILYKCFGKQCVEVKSQDTVEIINLLNAVQTFTMDRIFDTAASQKQIYDEIAKPLIDDVLKGYNGTIFTYGQSGSGKTYTMYGENIFDDENQGIIPRSIIQIFDFINDEKNKEIKFELKFSMLEIYMENIYDILNPETKPSDLKIKEHTKKGIYVENLSEIYITSKEEFLLLIDEAEKCRSVSETSLNKNSSRSHLLFQLEITQKLQDDTERRGLLNLIDLAGSEKVSKTHAIGITLEEAKKINLSLSNLGNVIYALASNADYIPYRDSKLTRILQDSLGGNSKTLLIVNCSIHSYNAEETISTLLFAKRAKKIKNKVKINIKRSPEQLEAIIEYLTFQLKKANDEIDKLKSSSVVNSESYSRKDSLGFLNSNNNIQNNLNNLKEFIKQSSKNDSYDDNCVNFISDNKNNFEILSELKKFKKENNIDLEVNQQNNLQKKFGESKVEELEKIIINKEQEIADLKQEVENLISETRSLNDKLAQTLKESNIENTINQIENSMKQYIKDLTNIYDNIRYNENKLLKENLVELKNYQIELENKYVETLREIAEVKDNDLSNLVSNKNNFNTSKVTENIFQNLNTKFSGNNYTRKGTNHQREFDLNTDKELTLFENYEDVMNNSISTINQVGSQKGSTKNTLKFTVKRTNNNDNSINNQNSDIFSMISKNNNNNNYKNSIIPSLNEKNFVSKDLKIIKKNDIPLYSNLKKDNKSRSEKIFNTTTNNMMNKDLNIINQSNTIRVIDNLSPEALNKNQQIISTPHNLFGTANFRSNEKKKEESKKDKFILNSFEFNIAIEELFKKIESNLKQNNFKLSISESPHIQENFLSPINIKTTSKATLKDIKKLHLDTDSGALILQDNRINDNFVNKSSSYNQHLILSYKKIMTNNKFYSKKIIENFLRDTESEIANQNKADENLENSVLYNIKNNNIFLDDNKSTIKTIDKRNDLHSNFNFTMNINHSTMQEDLFSVNDRVDRKDHIKILHDLNNVYNNNNNNNNNNDDKYAGGESKLTNRVRNSFVKLILSVIYYEKITFDLLSRLSLDIKIFYHESSYRKSLSKNLPQFILIIENYLLVLDELKKTKFRRETEENKIGAYQSFINNVNYLDPFHKNSLAKEDNLHANNTNNYNGNINKSNESINYPIIEDDNSKDSPRPSQKNKGNIDNKLFLDKKESYLFSNTNVQQNHTSNASNLFTINTKKQSNLIKSIPKHQSTIQNNITFSNYGLFLNNRNSNSQNLDSNLIHQQEIICQNCNCANIINLNSHPHLNPNTNYVHPFKLGNINDITNLESNNNLYKRTSYSPSLDINKRNSLEFKITENYFKKEVGQIVHLQKKSSENLIINANELKKNIERSPDKDLITNLKIPISIRSNKFKVIDFNNINSVNNTPGGVNNFSLTSPNNYLATNEKEKFSLKGRLEFLRQSIISNTSNRKISDEGLFISEFKLAKKESSLYKSCFEAISNEFKNHKFFEKSKEESLEKFYDENRVIFEKEVTSFWKALKIYKEIFTDQIKSKDNKINEMSKIFDDMILDNSSLLNNNFNSYNHTINQNNPNHDLVSNFQTDSSKLKEEFLKSLAQKKKNSVINEENIFKDKDFLKLAEAFYKEEGTATKKLDYVTIELKDNSDKIGLKYGSGLNKHIPTKSPLYKGFTCSLAGDEAVDNISIDDD